MVNTLIGSGAVLLMIVSGVVIVHQCRCLAKERAGRETAGKRND